MGPGSPATLAGIGQRDLLDGVLRARQPIPVPVSHIFLARHYRRGRGRGCGRGRGGRPAAREAFGQGTPVAERAAAAVGRRGARVGALGAGQFRVAGAGRAETAEDAGQGVDGGLARRRLGAADLLPRFCLSAGPVE